MDKETEKRLQNLFVKALEETKMLQEKEQRVKEDEEMKSIIEQDPISFAIIIWILILILIAMVILGVGPAHPY